VLHPRCAVPYGRRDMEALASHPAPAREDLVVYSTVLARSDSVVKIVACAEAASIRRLWGWNHAFGG
jgi:hypothetical protein